MAPLNILTFQYDPLYLRIEININLDLLDDAKGLSVGEDLVC